MKVNKKRLGLVHFKNKFFIISYQYLLPIHSKEFTIIILTMGNLLHLIVYVHSNHQTPQLPKRKEFEL